MATRSTIWYKDKENDIYKGIYCHWDGDIDYNGKILFDYYNDINKIKELVQLGSISSLNKNINPSVESNHSFEKPEKDTVIAYHRDRGEDLCIYNKNTLEGIKSLKEDFNYLFENDCWNLLNNDLSLTKIEDLLKELNKDEIDR